LNYNETCGTPASPAASELHVPAAVNEYDYLVGELEEVVATLQGRVEGLVYHTSNDPQDDYPSRGVAPYAERVARSNDRLRAVINSVRYTLSVLQV
jgi:hypothetical protein